MRKVEDVYMARSLGVSLLGTSTLLDPRKVSHELYIVLILRLTCLCRVDALHVCFIAK